MPLDVDYSICEGLAAPLDEADVGRVLSCVLQGEGVVRPCMVSVSLVSDEEMRGLNLEWRGIDAPTDVLSLECERPDDPDLAEDEPCELGDIVLAPAYILEQATQLAVSPEAEFTLLLVHGLLHLLGYDHVEEDAAELMEAREDAYVSMIMGKDTHVTLTRHKEDGA